MRTITPFAAVCVHPCLGPLGGARSSDAACSCLSSHSMKRKAKRRAALEQSQPVGEATIKRRRTTRSQREVAKDGDEDGEEETRDDRRPSTSAKTVATAMLDKTAEGISSLSAVKAKLEGLLDNKDGTELDEYLLELEADPRGGIPALVAKAQQQRLQRQEEWQRLQTMMEYEMAILSQQSAQMGGDHAASSFYLVGVDEVGVGPLAGPIVSCAVAFRFPIPRDTLSLLIGINDSKKLSVANRVRLADAIKRKCAVAYSLGIVTSEEVDELNPLQGSLEAMKRAVVSLTLPPSSTFHVLVDHHTITGLEDSVRQTSITKGDTKSIVIAAASIVAKVHRDEYMALLHHRFPHFGFDRNAGYGTKEHLDQLRRGVTCPEHRFSFEPVRLAKRKAMGSAPDQPPKKIRAGVRAADASRKKRQAAQAVPSNGTPTSEPSSTPPTIFSLRWWTSWFPSTGTTAT